VSKKPKSGVVIDSRYRLLHEIGSGNMGVVWAAEHVKLGYPLAVKLVRDADQASHETVVRFEREASAGAVLGAATDHVARTFEYGCDAVYGPYFTMELLDGVSLDRYLAEHGRLSVRQTAAFLEQMASALREAHAHDMVLRDVKPSNLMVVRHRGKGVRIKMIDFGVVKILPPGDGPAGTVIAGTPSYMSREQIRGEPIDARVDCWAISVVLYEMLTSRLPFVGHDFETVKKAIHVGDVVPPSRVVSRLGPRIDAFFERAFAADISRRFATIDELEGAFAAASRPTPPPGAEPTRSRRYPRSAPPSAAPSRRRPSGAPPSAAGASSKARAACTTTKLMPTLRSPGASQRGAPSVRRHRVP
jgi:serine/threonine-protein kinase